MNNRWFVCTDDKREIGSNSRGTYLSYCGVIIVHSQKSQNKRFFHFHEIFSLIVGIQISTKERL